jgi:hypothetical protein
MKERFQRTIDVIQFKFQPETFSADILASEASVSQALQFAVTVMTRHVLAINNALISVQATNTTKHRISSSRYRSEGVCSLRRGGRVTTL